MAQFSLLFIKFHIYALVNLCLLYHMRMRDFFKQI